MEKKVERIAKFISSRGIYSRREAEKLIINGDVLVNGKKILHPLYFVSSKDNIVIKGRKIKEIPKVRIFLYHKPKGLITSHKDPQGRTTVFEKLPKKLGKLISVGRLDYNTEGLLILTNNGAIKRFLELPINKIQRTYKAKIYGNLSFLNIKEIQKGIKINNIKYAPIKIKITTKKDKTSWIELQLTEGKNREIRKVLENYNLKVIKLLRISYGKFSLQNIKKNEIVELHYNDFKDIISLI